jgi:guanosine-3',5'-bis(diphosphate) 3'-pyrophosphohydrolase
MLSFLELFNKIISYNQNSDRILIQKAYVLAKHSHGNQKRHSGDPYFAHPVAVAEIVISLKLDDQSIITALLHDVVEDTEVSLVEIKENFGNEIASLVDGVTKLGKIEVLPANERLAENFRKLTMAMSQDIRVLLIKLADRLHNMRTLHFVPSAEKRIKKAKESLEIYAPLAGRIGLNNIKDELQELAFSIIHPQEYQQIVEKLQDIKQKNQDLIDKILSELQHLVTFENFVCHISGREKKPYSIWKKMQQKNIGFYSLHDIMAFRILVEDISDCYKALGIVNSNFNMIPGTFKDYISTPKENGYQSLHLVILGPFNKKIEIQIRSKTMHEIAEIGLAAHWHYKQHNKNKFSATNLQQENNQYRWIRELIHLFETSESASEVLKHNKLAMHKDEVFCFTPNGDIFNLPFGSTIIDFAYAVHSEVGNSCISGKINGNIAPLRQKLENGDQVEIIISKNAKPSPNWLQFTFTSKAKAAIRNFIKNEKFNEYVSLGKAILHKFFVSKEKELQEKDLEKALHHFGKKSISDLYFKVAEGGITRQEVFKILHPEYKETIKKPEKIIKKNQQHQLPIEGLVDGMAIKYAGCCNPIFGDPIIGIINTGVGITIHRQSCLHLKNLALTQQRVLDIHWKNQQNQQQSYTAQIYLVIDAKNGGLADITSIVAKKKVNITSIKTLNKQQETLEILLNLTVANLQQLEEIISSLKMSNKVISAGR